MLFSVVLGSLIFGVFADDPLILTKYLEKGDISGGQNAAKVDLNGTSIDPPVLSYSGYFTVDAKHDSNMFFWYFPSERSKNDPVVVWLQGGPGSSSMFGLFMENGPLQMNGSEPIRRQYSWSKVSNIVYIDNPVGTGFSFTNSSEGYVTNEDQVGDALYSTMLQFFTLFPHLQKNDLFITGESYGGKYVPALAYKIHTYNPSQKLKLNLKGIAMGDGFSDPYNMINYGDYLYQMGLIDSSINKKFQTIQNQIQQLILSQKYGEANDLSNQLLGGGPGSLFTNVSGITSYYNYYNPDDNGSDQPMSDYLNRDDVKAKIHTSGITFKDLSMDVNTALSADIMKSIAPWLIELANNYKVIVYNGQLDIIVAYPLTVNFLRSFNWCGQEDYLKTPRKIWYVDTELAGYTRTVKPSGCNGTLIEIMVRNAGHMVPQDQPKWAFDIITKLVDNQDF